MNCLEVVFQRLNNLTKTIKKQQKKRVNIKPKVNGKKAKNRFDYREKIGRKNWKKQTN